uniref:Uncharacterized protein n=1 Tax=Rhizophora mucronata TaxID=61149 RepID=A0A2P2PRV4_RHIMU
MPDIFCICVHFKCKIMHRNPTKCADTTTFSAETRMLRLLGIKMIKENMRIK